MKVVTIVGARPEFIMTAPLSRALRARHTELLIHTGQHYDDKMSAVFFEEFGIPQPDYNLHIGSGTHADQTGTMMMRLEPLLMGEQPDWVLVYGDTNSTLAGALCAAKLNIPVAHVEAGLRSFDRKMPEETNRVVVDHISTLLFAPTDIAVANLQREGITAGVRQVGDVRVDVFRDVAGRVNIPSLLTMTGLTEGEPFALATIHRPSNTDEPCRLRQIMDALSRVPFPVVLPVHPRLRKALDAAGLELPAQVHGIEPVGFTQMAALLNACRVVITDSGGLQKEAYLMRRPAITLRDTTEWVETVQSGWNRLSEPDASAFDAALDQALAPAPATHPAFYGEPGVSERICAELEAIPQAILERV